MGTYPLMILTSVIAILTIWIPGFMCTSRNGVVELRGTGGYYRFLSASSEDQLAWCREVLKDPPPGIPNQVLETCRKLVGDEGVDVLANCTRLKPIQVHPDPPVDLWTMLDEGYKMIELDDSHKEAVLLVGNSGSGKTTVTQILAGNLSKLHSVLSAEGRMIIVDDDEKIGFATLKSKTLIPDLVLDPVSATAYYDCPGFDDNRGPETDISVNFFLKKVTDHLSSFKLLFVIPHGSLEEPRGADLDRLARNAARFVQSMGNLGNVVALVVTRTPGISATTGRVRTDEEIKSEITSYLNSYLQLQMNKLETTGDPAEKITLQGTIAFVNNILPDNIGFIRNPRVCSALSENSDILRTKEALLKLISSLDFVSVDKTGFGYSLSERTANRVAQLADEQGNNIKQEVEKLVKFLETMEEGEFAKLYDLKDKESFYEGKYQLLSALMTQLSDSSYDFTSPIKFAKTVVNKVQDSWYVNPATFSNFQAELQKAGDILDFFEEMTKNIGIRISRNVPLWSSPIQQYTYGPLQMKSSWYTFLLGLDQELGSYKFQKNKAPLGLPVAGNELQFLKDAGLKVPADVEKAVEEKYLSEINHMDLRSVVMSAMQPPAITCWDGGKTVLVRGHFIRTSEFVNDDGTPTDKICQGYHFFRVHVTRRLYMDADVKAIGSGLQLSMVAPILEVIGNSVITIDLTGMEGQCMPPAKTECSSTKPDDGEPGLPGGPGGSYFGSFQSIEGAELLRILADGGRGSAGQDGQPGCEGPPGADATEGEAEHGYESERDCRGSLCSWKGTAYGHGGTPGVPGGNGGAGGLGGIPGNIHIIPDTNKVNTSSVGEDAKNGAAGKGGNGGLGGKNGDGKKCWFVQSIFGVSNKGCETLTTTERGNTGAQGSDGANFVGQKKPSKIQEGLQQFKLINDYKVFALTAPIPVSILPFIETLDNDVQLQNPKALSHEVLVYQTELLAKEGNEKRSPAFGKYYKALPKRIENYVTHHNTSSQEKLILSKLYATVLSSVRALSGGERTSMVVNVLEYINVVHGNLNKLKNTESVAMVQQQTKKYKGKFEAKIKQSLDFMDTKVQPALSSIEKEIEDVTRVLLQKIADDTKNATTDLQKAKELQWEMESAMRKRYLLSTLKIFGQGLQFFGVYGAIAGGVLGSVTSTVEPFLLDDFNKVRVQTTLPPSIKGQVSGMESQFKIRKEKRLASMKELMEKFKDDIKSKNQKELGDLEKNVKELEEQIVRSSEGTSRTAEADPELLQKQNNLFAEIEKKRGGLKDRLEKEIPKEQDEKKRQEEETRAQNALHILDKVQTAVRFGETAVDVYNKISNDKAQLKVLSEDVAKAEENLRRLKEYRESIYNAMIPDMRNMALELDKVAESLSGQSPVSLQVTKWEMQTKLKEFKFRLKQMTDGQKLQENFILCVEKLDEAMSILINLYDFIEKYQEQLELAQFMANINQAGAQHIMVDDAETSEFLNKLDISLQTHSFLKEYGTAVQAVKQWVFPFANLYLEDLQLPKNISFGMKPVDVAMVLGDHISKLQGKIREYKSVILKEQDDYLRYTIFSSKFVSTHPFFIWKGEDWPVALTDILSGKPVSLIANVDFAATKGKGAVKFTVAELTLRAKNQGNQTFVDEVMQSFGINMVHSGVSHYTFLGSRYFMVGENQTYGFNYEEDQKGNRINPTSVYKKFKNGDFLMSPYTLWTFQIVKAKDAALFEDLGALDKMVDLELSGIGSYVDEKLFAARPHGDMKLDEYYEVEDAMITKS